MLADLPDALLSRNRSGVLHRDESEYWDYKEELRLDTQIAIARFAKDVLAFHNTNGGMIAVGITNDFKVRGVPRSQVIETVDLHKKLRRYIGPSVSVFQNSIPSGNAKRAIWLIFVPRRQNGPVAVASAGPHGQDGRPVIRQHEFYVRFGDETRPCTEPADFARLFAGVSMEHLQAYIYDLDEPYFRLLAPQCERFVGRVDTLARVYEALQGRHPVIALDGLGGVGKTAVAIELVRQLYRSNAYLFIVSISAKSRIWQGSISSRKAGFSGLTELLQEIAAVLQLPPSGDTEALKRDVINAMRGLEGLLLVDNIEDVEDQQALHFLAWEIPEPVKCLVTSRIDKKLGAPTISIPAMNDDEARQLFRDELQRLGYTGLLKEAADEDEILRATGRLPLALKWAASVAASCGSLREASSRLRRTDAKKEEFLTFCFRTMYDALSPLARDTAQLCAYLGEEWHPGTVCIALEKPEPDVALAFEELKDRGVVFAASSTREGALSVLPLTRDFLASRWHENENLRRQVLKRLADSLGSEDGEGLLLRWKPEQRIAVVRKRADELRSKGDFAAANRLIRLGLRWAADPDLLFLHGRVLYESGRRMDGIALMLRALEGGDRPAERLEERLILGQALVDHGGNAGQRDGLALIESAIRRGAVPTPSTAEKYCNLCLELREYASLRKALEHAKGEAAYLLAKSLKKATEHGDLIYTIGEGLGVALEFAERWDRASAEERLEFAEMRRRVLRRLRPDASASG